MLEHLARCAIQSLQLSQQLILGQIVQRRVFTIYLRRQTTRDEHVPWQRTLFTSQEPRHFKRNKSTHAVTEERKRLVKKRCECPGNRLYDVGEFSDQRLVHSRGTTRQLNRHNFHTGRQFLRPASIDQRTATG